MNKSIKFLIILLVVLAGLLFVYSIVQAGLNTLNGHPDIHSFFSNAVIIIAGILSTNLGAVLGVTLTPPKPFSSQLDSSDRGASVQKFLGLRPSFQTEQETVRANDVDTSQKFQIIACWVYVIGLLIATIFYVVAIDKSIPDDKIVPVLPELSKTLVGVFIGALTVALGRPTP